MQWNQNGEGQQRKCIVCNLGQGKDKLLGPKFDTLEKNVESERPLKICHMFGLRKTNGIITKNVAMCKIKSFYKHPSFNSDQTSARPPRWPKE